MSNSHKSSTHADYNEAGRLYSYSLRPDGFLADEGDPVAWRWTGFALADARARSSIEEIEGLPVEARRCLLAEGRRVYLKQAGGWLFGTLPDIHHRHYGESEELGLVHFALNADTLLTARKRPLQTIDDIRRKIEERQAAFLTPAAFVDAVVTHLLDLLEDRLDDLFEDLDRIEDHVLRGRWASERERIAPLRRQVIVVHRHLFLVSGLFRPLSISDLTAVAPQIKPAIENSQAWAASLLHDSEQLQARALLLQEEIMGRLSERTNQLLYVLSILTAVLMPMTIVSGLFGMNLHGIPFTDWPHGFWAASFVAIVGAAAVYLFVRRIGGRD